MTPRVAEAVHDGTRIPARISAVVFDMDGVLLDTEELWSRAEERLCAAHGVRRTPDDDAATLGVLVLEACRHYARRFGLPESAAPRLEAELLGFMATELDGPVTVLPGARELIDRLRDRIPVAVASNSRRVVVERAVAKAGLWSAFAAILSADDVARPKPAPDIYAEACRSMRVLPRDALALEDSPVGATAALAAGLSCYLVSPDPPPAGLGVDLRVGSLVELLPDGRHAARASAIRARTASRDGTPFSPGPSVTSDAAAAARSRSNP
jgi:HAD superfamily hydrolase (TIGR01509 family)